MHLLSREAKQPGVWTSILADIAYLCTAPLWNIIHLFVCYSSSIFPYGYWTQPPQLSWLRLPTSPYSHLTESVFSGSARHDGRWWHPQVSNDPLAFSQVHWLLLAVFAAEVVWLTAFVCLHSLIHTLCFCLNQGASQSSDPPRLHGSGIQHCWGRGWRGDLYLFHPGRRASGPERRAAQGRSDPQCKDTYLYKVVTQHIHASYNSTKWFSMLCVCVCIRWTAWTCAWRHMSRQLQRWRTPARQWPSSLSIGPMVQPQLSHITTYLHAYRFSHTIQIHEKCRLKIFILN